MHHLNISLNSCVFFFRNPSTYIWVYIFNFVSYIFSIARFCAWGTSVNSLPRVTISLVISTVDTHPLNWTQTPALFSVFHFSPSKQLCFWCYTFFLSSSSYYCCCCCKEKWTSSSSAFSRVYLHEFVHIFWVREREKIMSNLIFFSLFCLRRAMGVLNPLHTTSSHPLWSLYMRFFLKNRLFSFYFFKQFFLLKAEIKFTFL